MVWFPSMESVNMFCGFDDCRDDGASSFDPSKPPIYDSEFEFLFDLSKPPIFDEEYGGVLRSLKEDLSQGTNLVVHMRIGEIVQGQIWSDYPCGVIPMLVLSRRSALLSNLDVRLFGFETLNNYCVEFSDFGETFASCETGAFHEFVIQDGVLVKGRHHCVPKRAVIGLPVHESLGEKHKSGWHKRMLRLRSKTEMGLDNEVGSSTCSSWLLVSITKFASLFVVFVFDPGKMRSSIFFMPLILSMSRV